MKDLLAEGANANAANTLGVTPLMGAATIGNNDAVKVLQRARAKVNT